MFDRTKNFFNLIGASHRTARALKSGVKPTNADLKILGVDASNIKTYR